MWLRAMEESDRFPNVQEVSQQVMVMDLGEDAVLHERNPGRTRSERTEGRGVGGRTRGVGGALAISPRRC